MTDEFEEYQVVLLESFRQSLADHVDGWEALGMTDGQITKYVSAVQNAVNSLQYWPGRFQDVTELYGFSETTYRIPVGKIYAIFYRVKPELNSVIVGAIFDRRRLKVDF